VSLVAKLGFSGGAGVEGVSWLSGGAGAEGVSWPSGGAGAEGLGSGLPCFQRLGGAECNGVRFREEEERKGIPGFVGLTLNLYAKPTELPS
jgi:hypothetical protein